MQLKTSLLLLLLIFANVTLSKRSSSRGRSRGSSSSSTTFWTRKSKSSSEPKPVVTQPKPVVAQPKPSAPKEPEVKKQTANVQQSAPNSRPIGWDVDKTNVQKQNVNPSYAAPNPQHAGAASYPNSGMYPQNPGHAGYGYGQPAGGYPNHGVQQGYNPQPYPVQSPGLYQNNMGGYGNYPHVPQPNMGYGNVPQSNMGYGHVPPMQQTGLMGSLMGGNKHGFGGGYGGFGGYGGYGYGMKKSGGFFGKHAFRNVLGGIFVWYLVSGLVSRPYKVYNFYNQPEVREEITLPANVLTLCNENATNICVPGSTAICTQDNKILCVSTLATASPCPNNNGELCVNSTIPCIDTNDPLCQNKTTPDNTTMVNLPCLTSMTLEKDSTGVPPNISLPVNENKFCVTTMAVPDPSLPMDDGKKEIPTNQEVSAPANVPAEGFNGTLPVKL